MATIGFAIAGRAAGALLGPVGAIAGGIIGGIAGSYLDSFLKPYLFPEPQARAPRIDQIQVSHQDEGAPAPFVVAGTTRVEGTVIWQNDPISIPIEKDGGGKGGGKKQVVGERVYWDVAVAFEIGECSEIEKIIIEGQTIYNRSPDVSVTNAGLAVSVIATGNSTKMKIATSDTSIDLSRFVTGKSVVVSGFANGANNGTFKVKGKGRDKATGASYVILKNTSAVAETAGASVTLFQDLDPYDTAVCETITIYKGTATQTADPTIEAIQGTGNVSGYRGTTYVVFHNLALGPYGNRAPQAFNAIITATGATTVAAAITTIVTRSGRSSGDIDVTSLTDSIDGQALSGPTPGVGSIQPLLIAYDLLTQETAGVTRFFPRREARVIDIPAADLAAHDGTVRDFPILVDDSSESKLPSRVIVDFVDLENNYQPGSTNETQGRFSAEDAATVNLPIALTGAHARAIARRFRWLAWNQRKVNLSLPPSYWYVQENDLLRFKALGRMWLVLVNKVDVGANYIIRCECTEELRDVLTQQEDDEGPNTKTNGIGEPGDIEGDVVELPPLGEFGTTASFNVPIAMVHARKTDPNAMWGPGALFHSDDDSEFRNFQTIDRESTAGSALTDLNGAGIDPHIFDYASTVDVILDSGELESRTEDEVLNGLNTALIGNEIVGFATATLIGERQYRLSTLLRGIADTMDEMDTHVAGERFVLLDDNSAEQVPFSLTWIDRTKYFRFVAGGASVGDADSQSQVITGASLKPFSPANAEVFRDGSSNITLNWDRRTRIPCRVLSSALIPLGEASERYEIDIFEPGAPTVILRTISATSETASYSAANQSTDGFGAFDSVGFRIYQLSEIVGRGKPLEHIG